MGDTSKRGFASMNDDAKRKVASEGGKAVSQNREHMSEIGKKGGETRKKELGEAGYKQLGHKGGQATAEEHQSDDFYHKIGKKCGEARKEELGTKGYSNLGHMGGSAQHVSRGRQSGEKD